MCWFKQTDKTIYMHIQLLSMVPTSLREFTSPLPYASHHPPPPSLAKIVAMSPATYRRLTRARHPARYLAHRISFCGDRNLGPGRDPLLSSFVLSGSWGIPWGSHIDRAACQTCLPVGSSVIKITCYTFCLGRATSFGRETKTHRNCVELRIFQAGCYRSV